MSQLAHIFWVLYNFNWQYHIALDLQGMDKIMEMLDNIGIKLFVLAALKEH
jgi:hypothetical protein